MWKDPGVPWAVICSVLFLALSLLKEGDFSHMVVFQLSLVETYPLAVLQRESGGEYIFTSLYSEHRDALLIRALNRSRGDSLESHFFHG